MVEEPRIIPLAVVKEILEKQQGERGELNYEQKLASEHSKLFSRMSAKQSEELLTKLGEIKKLTPAHIVKIVDLCPVHPDDVRSVFARERFQLEKEEIDKIIALVQSYSG